jgi:hypothetical protein
MFQRSGFRLMSLIGFVGMLAASPAWGEESWKLYDVRDLISLLPPVPAQEGDLPQFLGGRPLDLFGRFHPARHSASDGDGAGSAAGIGQQESKKPRFENQIDALIDRVCGMLQIECALLFTGVYGIRAEQAEHAHVQHLLESIRNLYKERYAVELVLYRVPANEAPVIGDAANWVASRLRHQFVAPRRTPTSVQLITQQDFLRALEPVVATGAIGYASRIDRLNDGLRLSVLIGAGENHEDKISIQVSGDLRWINWEQRRDEFQTPSGPISIELPTERIRSINASLGIPLDKPTVLSVIAGFHDEECYVLAGSVRKQ